MEKAVHRDVFKPAASSNGLSCFHYSWVQLVADLTGGRQLWPLSIDTEGGTVVSSHAPDNPTWPGKAWLPSSPHIPWPLQQDTATMCVIYCAREMFSSPALGSVPCIAFCEMQVGFTDPMHFPCKDRTHPLHTMMSGANDRNQTPGGAPLTTLTSNNGQFSLALISWTALILSKYHVQMMHYKKSFSKTTSRNSNKNL